MDLVTLYESDGVAGLEATFLHFYSFILYYLLGIADLRVLSTFTCFGFLKKKSKTGTSESGTPLLRLCCT